MSTNGNDMTYPQSFSQEGPFGGLTKREYFAAKFAPVAYQTFIEESGSDPWPEEWRLGVAFDAVRMADALIAALNKRGEE